MRLPLSCLTALLVFAPAHAETTEPVTAKIVYTQEQLETEAGAEEVFEMILQEARRTCRMSMPGKLRSLVVDRDCATNIVTTAVTNIDAPALNDAYENALTQGVISKSL